MTYELRALVAKIEALTPLTAMTWESPVPLAQGFALLPITNAVFDRLGGKAGRLGRPGFWFLSAPLEALGTNASRISPVAYIEANFFGGIGDQAAIVWFGGQVVLGPLRLDIGLGAPALGPSWSQPVNAALRRLGVDAGNGEGGDEFEHLGLGWFESTELWSARGRG